MDVSAVNPPKVQTNAHLSGHARSAEAGITRNSQIVEEPVKVAAVEKAEVAPLDEKRYQAVQRAAHTFFKDTYVVSDKKFTIFKDNHGQFITRFTNLRDGTVTYYPEPEMLKRLEMTDPSEMLVELKA